MNILLQRTSSLPLGQLLIPSHTDDLSMHVPSLHVKSLGEQVAWEINENDVSSFFILSIISVINM